MLELSIHPGVVSTFYFVFLDLTLLTVLDYSLSRLLSSLYYQRVHNGHPLRLTSCDVTGVTSFLLGRRASLANLFALLLKLMSLVAIVALEWNIQSEFRPKPILLHGTYNLDPSSRSLNMSTAAQRKVERLWYAMRMCRRVEPGVSNVTFYHVAYNFTEGIVLESEFMDEEVNYVPIDKSTVTCMSADQVACSWVLATLGGCTTYGRPVGVPCAAENHVTRHTGDKDLFQVARNPYQIMNLYGFMYMIVTLTQDEVLSILPEYGLDGGLSSLDMTCMRTAFRPGDGRTVTSQTTCLTTLVSEENTTAFECWHYNIRTYTLESSFAGPVFDGTLDVGLYAKALFLIDMQRRSLDYVSLASIIIADSSVFSVANRSTDILTHRVQVTVIPTFAVILFIVMTSIIVAFRVVVSLLLNHRKSISIRPPKGDNKTPWRQSVVHLSQLNCINGISELASRQVFQNGPAATEENLHIVLGFSMNKVGSLRFGPLLSDQEAVKFTQDMKTV